MEDILTMEFGISPKQKAVDMVQEYGHEHIRAALQTAREYINKLRKRGQKVDNVGGIARKAIEEGWKPQESAIEVEYEVQQQAISRAKVVEKQQEDVQEAEKERIQLLAMSLYESMGEGERAAFLSDFRENLVDTGNKLVVKRYDEDGISPGMVEGMLAVFIRERLGENP